MKVTLSICDRCGKEDRDVGMKLGISPLYAILKKKHVSIGTPETFEEADLCEACSTLLFDWMETKQE